MASAPVPIGLPRYRAPTGERTQDYVRSLRAAGGEARFLEPAPEADPRRQLQGLAGLLLTGGVDVDPAHYGQRPHPETDRPHPDRDRYELALLEEALRRDIPILAICRGHQLLNVRFGGRLIQHIDGDTVLGSPRNRRFRGVTHRADHDTGDSAWHEVTVVGESRMGRALGYRPTLRVNSRHHQGVGPAEKASGLAAAAVSPDSLIEALESPSHRWVLGVQWHPERPEMATTMAGLFAAFVAAARAAMRPVGE